MNKPSQKKPQDTVRPHVYDGIQEYDNPMPNWWLWTFYGAIIFSVIYWFSWYNTDTLQSDAERIEQTMAKVQEARLAATGDLNDETLWEMSENEGFIESGRETYREKCVSCHGPNLQGGIGLSLVDNSWKWGNKPMSIYAIIANGSPDKSTGMQAWMNELGAKKVMQVTAFILSHHDPESMEKAESINDPIEL